MTKITANYTDPKLKQIRKATADKSDEIPFLLLPVRLETRFMKVKKTYTDSSDQQEGIEEIIQCLAEAQILLSQDTKNTRLTELKKLAKETQKKLRSARRILNRALPLLTKKQKAWIQSFTKPIEQRLTETFKSKSQDSPFFKLHDILRDINRKLASDKSAKDRSKQPARALLAQLRKLEIKLQKLKDGKIPYTRPAQKRQLYIFTDKIFNHIEQLYDQIQEEAQDIKHFDEAQLKKLNSSHRRIKSLLNPVLKALGKLHQDRNWQAFIQAKREQIKQFRSKRAASFEKTTVQRLEYIAELKPIMADELFYRNMKLLVNLKEQENQEVKDLKEGVERQRKMKKDIKKLAKMNQRLVYTNTKQLQQLNSLRRTLDKSLDQIKTSFDKVKQPERTPGRRPGTIRQLGIHTKLSTLPKPKPLSRDFTTASISSNKIEELVQFDQALSTQLQKLNRSLGRRSLKASTLIKGLDLLESQVKGAQKQNLQIPDKKADTLGKKVLDLTEKLKSTELKKEEKESIADRLADLRKKLLGSASSQLEKRIDKHRFSDKPIVGVPFYKMENELWVRIYPDDIFVHTHEKALTEEEETAGKEYWQTIWATDDDEEMVLGVWKMLCARFGTNRASWIVKSLDPNKLLSESNSAQFEKKAKSELTDLIEQLRAFDKELQQELSSAKAKTSFQIASSDRNSLLKQLDDINESFKKLKRKDQYAARMEKCAFLIRSIQSKLVQTNRLDQKSFRAGSVNTRSRNSILNWWKKLGTALEELDQNFAELQLVSLKEYLKNTEFSFKFPTVKRRDSDWTVTPHSKVLPNRFVVITVSNSEFRHVVVGNPVPEDLPLGMDPNLFDLEEADDPYQLDEHGNLSVEPGIRWMTDFEEAVSKGMGIKIFLSEEDAQRGFDQVFVLGINEADKPKSRKLLEDLIQNHQHSDDGMSILKIGTSTNNTDQASAGFSIEAEDAAQSHARELGDPLFDKAEADSTKMADGKRLYEALGIRPKFLEHISNAGGTEISDALLFNRVLAYATLRDYMEEMMEAVFTQDNIERTKTFFQQFVSGRGILPSIRIGSQPYGMLVTSAFSRFVIHKNMDIDSLPEPESESNLQQRFDIRLKHCLDLLHKYWTIIRKEDVHHAHKLEQSEMPQADFFEMLGVQATSATNYFRYAVNIAYRGQANASAGFIGEFQDADHFGPQQLYTLFSSLIDTGFFEGEIETSTKGHFEQSKIFRARFLEDSAEINGEHVDAQIPSDAKFLIKEDNKNYIDWLLSNNLLELLGSNDAENFPSRSVLFLLLRQAILLVYRNAAMHILEQEEVFDRIFRRRIGSHEHFMSPKEKFRTKWSYLFLRFTIQSGEDNGNFDLYFDFDREDISDILDNEFIEYLINDPGADDDEIDPANARSIATYLYHHADEGDFPDHAPFLSEIEAFRTDLERLGAFSTRQLNQLLNEHLDLCHYRLDAWMLGYAHQRLLEQRQANPEGIHLGAFAWVEELRPGGERTLSDKVPKDLKTDGIPIYADEDNQGYIHAPSINQAITAAVLRGGFESNKNEEDISNQFAINLSSHRVRKALHIIEGISNGLELGAVLGYQFEKGLHERYTDVELDKFIQPFRKAFPLTVPIADDVNNEDIESSIQSNVTHGLDLIDKIYETIDDLEFTSNWSVYEILSQNNFEHCPNWLSNLVMNNGGNNTALNAILKEVDQIADAFDALGDLTVSESVYQIVQGNHVRASAIIEAMAEGKVMPEPLVAHTPRTGIVVNHRVILPLQTIPGDDLTKPTGWNSTFSLRAKTEASLNNWLGVLLGAAANIKFIVKVDDVSSSYALSDLDEFDLHPIDLLYVISTDSATIQTELDHLISYHLRKKDDLADASSIKTDFSSREASWGEEVKTIYELVPLLEPIKEMIMDVLPVCASDLMVQNTEDTELDNPGQQDFDELNARMEEAKDSFLQLLADISDFISDHLETELPFPSTDFDTALAHLKAAFYFGIPDALSNILMDETAENAATLLNKLKAVHKTMAKKEKEINSILANISIEGKTINKVSSLRELAQVLFGRTFVVFPHFTWTNTAAFTEQLDSNHANALQFGSADPFVMDSWLQGISKVRKKAAALNTVRTFREVYDQQSWPLAPVQFPHEAGDYWLGISYPEDYKPEEDKLSLIVVEPDLLTNTANKKVGIILDEWTEIIPLREETTGITFNYDQPDSAPPQSLLLAVTPERTGNWNWDDLVYTLIDTLELAKNRAVDPDHIEESVFGQVLPAVVSEVVPPQLRQHSDTFTNPLGTQVVLDYIDNLPPEEPE